MKKGLLLSFFFSFIISFCFAQDPTLDDLQKIANDIEKEGMLLYSSEFASWYGTDMFLAKYKDDKENIGGYFSYRQKKEIKCIFFSKDSNPKVIGTMTFDTSYNPQNGSVDLEVRDFTEKEERYYLLRKKAKEEITKNSVFKFYKNSNYNVVPIIRNDLMKVYVMTGTNENGKTLFGNDYLINFDDNYKITSVEPLHRSLLVVDCPVKDEKGENSEGYIHTHLPEFSPYMTPTDICTGMLYRKYLMVNQIISVSKAYLSIWNFETKKLIILPMSMAKAMNNDMDKH